MHVGIVALSGAYPFKIGGPQQSIYHLVKELSGSAEVQLTIYLRLYENNHRKEPLLPSNNVNTIPFVIREGEEAKLLLAISKIVCSREIDLMHYNSPPFFIDPLLLRSLKKPLTLDFHGGLFAENLFVNRPLLKLTASFLKSAFKLTASLFSRVIVHSQYMKRIAVTYGVPKAKIVIIPLGVNLKEFDDATPIPLEGSPILLFVGRLEPIKGCHVLLHALPHVVQYYPKLRLYIIGKGTGENYLKTLVSKLNIKDNVRFEGSLSREKLLSYYKCVDLCVFPSTYDEGFGLSVLEAMANGRAVIASSVGGMKERIRSGINGFQVDPNDVDALARKVLLLLGDDNLRRRLGYNAYKTARAHDWSVITLKYKEVFEEVLEGVREK